MSFEDDTCYDTEQITQDMSESSQNSSDLQEKGIYVNNNVYKESKKKNNVILQIAFVGHMRQLFYYLHCIKNTKIK